MKKNKKPQNYMQFLEEAAGVNIFNNLDSYSNPAKDIITWRGKKRKLLDTTIKSKDLDALVTDIVGKKGTKKVDSQFAEDFDFRNDGLDDLLEDDYGQGYDNLEEGWEYDGLEDIAESGNDDDDEVNDPLTGLEEEGNEDEDGLDDLVEDADPDEDDEDYDDDTLEESAFLDEDGEDLDVDFEELSESAIDDEDEDEEDTTPEVVEESDDSPLSMLEADTDEVSAVSALIQEIESLEDEGEYAISYDEYNDGIQEETDIVSAEEILQLKESKSSKFVKGKDKPEFDDSSDDEEEDDDEEDDSDEDDDFDEDEYEDD